LTTAYEGLTASWRAREKKILFSVLTVRRVLIEARPFLVAPTPQTGCHTCVEVALGALGAGRLTLGTNANKKKQKDKKDGRWIIAVGYGT
jgi:hypothetical protein